MGALIDFVQLGNRFLHVHTRIRFQVRLSSPAPVRPATQGKEREKVRVMRCISLAGIQWVKDEIRWRTCISSSPVTLWILHCVNIISSVCPAKLRWEEKFWVAILGKGKDELILTNRYSRWFIIMRRCSAMCWWLAAVCVIATNHK